MAVPDQESDGPILRSTYETTSILPGGREIGTPVMGSFWGLLAIDIPLAIYYIYRNRIVPNVLCGFHSGTHIHSAIQTSNFGFDQYMRLMCGSLC
jgi:hypothetical protein